MNLDDAERVDRRLAMALLTRMRTTKEPDALRVDLERMDNLIGRARSRPNDADEVLAEANRRLAKHLPEGDPEREVLEKKAKMLDMAHASRRKGQHRQNVQLPRPYDESRLTREHCKKIRVDAERGWPLPPPFPSDWKDLDQETLVRMAIRADAAYGSIINVNIFLNFVAGRCTSVPCYPGFELVEFLWVRPDGEVENLLFFLGKQVALWLTGVSPGIHELNGNTNEGKDDRASRASFLDLSDAAKAESYLRFFCAMVLGDEGPFRVIGSLADLSQFWLEDTVPHDVKEMIAPIEIERVDESFSSNGENTEDVAIWQIKACVSYGSVLFRSTFSIPRSGIIAMTEDDPLVSEAMPVIVERYEDGGRVAVQLDKNPKSDARTGTVFDQEPADTAHHRLAASLMRDAASFFNYIGQHNSKLAPQMSENSDVFLQVAELVGSVPLGKIDQEPYPTHAEVAAKLLLDAAEFLTSIADQNPKLSSQMKENADVFAQVAKRVRDDPLGSP